ncbi:unnamed protein product [Amoebophrya sp. A25]|nr:unnamed protein product [Amoebophrya sp. A25]|eukprot:GSA25T00021577001.1
MQRLTGTMCVWICGSYYLYEQRRARHSASVIPLYEWTRVWLRVVRKRVLTAWHEFQGIAVDNFVKWQVYDRSSAIWILLFNLFCEIEARAMTRDFWQKIMSGAGQHFVTSRTGECRWGFDMYVDDTTSTTFSPWSTLITKQVQQSVLRAIRSNYRSLTARIAPRESVREPAHGQAGTDRTITHDTPMEGRLRTHNRTANRFAVSRDNRERNFARGIGRCTRLANP